MKIAKQIIDKNRKHTTVHINPAKNVKQNRLAQALKIPPRIKNHTNLSDESAHLVADRIRTLKSGFLVDDNAYEQFAADLQNVDAFDRVETFHVSNAEYALDVRNADNTAILHVLTQRGLVTGMEIQDLTWLKAENKENHVIPQAFHDDKEQIQSFAKRLRYYD